MKRVITDIIKIKDNNAALELIKNNDRAGKNDNKPNKKWRMQ